MSKLRFRILGNPSLWITGEKERYLVVTDKNWHSYYPTTLPGADFRQNIYIVVYQGIKPDSGYQVRIKEITQSEDTVAVQVELKVPQAKLAYAQVMVHPIAVAEVTRAELKPANSLDFTFIDQKGKLLAEVNARI
ncbi:MAG: protease complex subunit PrcB family protein [Chloroflexi bacterium]|nr:protease complex subunit PrcB family protein [Chloroflexota bacterium]